MYRSIHSSSHTFIPIYYSFIHSLMLDIISLDLCLFIYRFLSSFIHSSTRVPLNWIHCKHRYWLQQLYQYIPNISTPNVFTKIFIHLFIHSFKPLFVLHIISLLYSHIWNQCRLFQLISPPSRWGHRIWGHRNLYLRHFVFLIQVCYVPSHLSFGSGRFGWIRIQSLA